MTIPKSFLAAESCLLLFPEEEKERITKLMRASKANRKEGDLFYLISHRWWRDWQEYVGLDRITEFFTFSEQLNEGLLHIPHRPGKIDNTELVLSGTNKESNELDVRGGLQEGVDYNLVPQEVWKKLLEWYGGGPELPRQLRYVCYVSKCFTVDVYPLRLSLIDARDNSQRTIRMSRKVLPVKYILFYCRPGFRFITRLRCLNYMHASFIHLNVSTFVHLENLHAHYLRDSVGELYKMVCALLDLELDMIHIWDNYNKHTRKMLNKLDISLEEAQLLMDQEILLDVKVDGLWPSSFGMDHTGNELSMIPMEPSMSSISISRSLNFSNGAHFLQGSSSSSVLTEDGNDLLSNKTKVKGRGSTGLHNLGNTCFMNSAIQCLAHTQPLVDYFLQDYTEQINKENPLGMEGELAIAFGELLRKLWSPGCVSVAPDAFKTKLARFAPQFHGFKQHDSQELLAFLLDGLHEDLNRVKCKPFIEAKDANGRSDEEFADECWNDHKARNDSIIVDFCQGQYKSTMVCPVCSKVSVTFDPFMYLSLPLPSTVARMMTVTVFSGEGSALPMPFTLTVPKNGCCKDLVRALSIACCLNSYEALLLAEVFQHRILRYLDNPSESLTTIKDDELIVAYRLPVNHENLLRLQIMHRELERYSSEPQYDRDSQDVFGTPLITCLATDSKTGEYDIQAAVGTVLAPLLWRKVCPQSPPKTTEDNHCAPSLDSIVLSDNSTCSSENLPSTSDVVLEDTAIPSFKLGWTDDEGVVPQPLSGSFIRVFLLWSDRELQLYDFSSLEYLTEVFEFGSAENSTQQEAVSLFSCLEAFLKEEPLGLEDMWYCPSCKEHRQATKKLDLWRLPEILVLHLKRFSYSQFEKSKLDTFVDYPVRNLDLSRYVNRRSVTPRSHVYELYAVSNHYGGLDGGHYTAYAKLIDVESWYDFNDSRVSPVSEDSITTSGAYLLFYKRVEVDSRMDVE